MSAVIDTETMVEIFKPSNSIYAGKPYFYKDRPSLYTNNAGKKTINEFAQALKSSGQMLNIEITGRMKNREVRTDTLGSALDIISNAASNLPVGADVEIVIHTSDSANPLRLNGRVGRTGAQNPQSFVYLYQVTDGIEQQPISRQSSAVPTPQP